jgi:hypothetical protein
MNEIEKQEKKKEEKESGWIEEECE